MKFAHTKTIKTIVLIAIAIIAAIYKNYDELAPLLEKGNLEEYLTEGDSNREITSIFKIRNTMAIVMKLKANSRDELKQDSVRDTYTSFITNKVCNEPGLREYLDSGNYIMFELRNGMVEGAFNILTLTLRASDCV